MAVAFAVIGGRLPVRQRLPRHAGEGHVIPGGRTVAGSLSAIGLSCWARTAPGNASGPDNATGVGILLEMARLSKRRSAHPVTLLFTDAEEEGPEHAARFRKAAATPGPAPLVKEPDLWGRDEPSGSSALRSCQGTGARLAQVLEVAAKRLDVRSVHLPAGAATDHYPAAYRDRAHPLSVGAVPPHASRHPFPVA